MDSKQRIDSTSRHHGHHKHHRHHRHGRNKKPLVIGIIVAAVAVALGSASVVNQLNRRKNYHVTGTNSVDVGAGYRYTEYNGKKYQYNNRVTTLLYAGLDSFDELKQTATYGDKARADSIMLIVLDEVSKKMSVVAINRDTLFNNLPIDGYMVSNQTSIVMINDLVGGVTVTVPNDDLAAKYPELTTGNVVTLDESNVRAYVQQRDTAVDFSNEGRIERQKSFVLSFMDEFGAMVKEDASSVWDSLEACSDWMQTDITKNKYLSLADAFSNTNLTPDSYYILEGEDQLGELHDEFYYDEDALQELIIKLFYREI